MLSFTVPWKQQKWKTWHSANQPWSFLIFSGSGASWHGFNCAKNSVVLCVALKSKNKSKKKKILKGWLFSASKHWRIVIISRGVEGSAFFFPPVLAASAISYFALLLHSPTSFIFWSWLGKPWALWGFCFHAFPFHCLLENKCINWVLGGSAPTLPCREIHITASQNPPVNRSADLNTLFY